MLAFSANWSLGISELRNHIVDLNVINHSDKYRIMLSWDVFAIMQGYTMRKSFQ